jgi:hypothetical protein
MTIQTIQKTSSLLPIETQEIRKRVKGTLEDYLNFYTRFVKNTEPGWPTWSQAIRIRALMNNKRILVADDTGVNGKTFTAIASKIALEDELGVHVPTFIIGTNDGLINAWSQSEVDMYAEKLHTRKQKVLTIRDFKDLYNTDSSIDFTVINWDKLSKRESSSQWKSLEHVLKVIEPKFYVLDECHNAKSHRSLRGKTIQRIVPYTLDKYLMLLSATPIPNRYRDLAMVFHLLDPIKYPDPTIFTYSPAEVMQELLDRQVWFRLTRQDLKEELGLPDFVEKVVPVQLSDKESELYYKAWSDCVTLGEGLTELRKILYNPSLSK